MSDEDYFTTVYTSATIDLNPYANMSPSHICMLCECLEYPSATMATNEPWICDKCKMALQRAIERETRLHEQETKND